MCVFVCVHLNLCGVSNDESVSANNNKHISANRKSVSFSAKHWFEFNPDTTSDAHITTHIIVSWKLPSHYKWMTGLNWVLMMSECRVVLGERRALTLTRVCVCVHCKWATELWENDLYKRHDWSAVYTLLISADDVFNLSSNQSHSWA